MKKTFLQRAAFRAEKVIRNFFYRLVLPLIFPNKQVKEKIDINSIKSILILRTDYVGDMICTTPMFSVIKKMNPNVRVYVAASDENWKIIEDNPFIDEKLILVRKGKTDNKVLKYLKTQNIDVLINAVKMNRTREGIWLNRISRKGIKVCFAHHERNYYTALYNKLPDFPWTSIPETNVELLRSTFTNGIKDEWIEMYIPVSPEAHEKWEKFCSENKIEKKKFIVVNLSVRQVRNKWTNEGYEYLLNKFFEDYPSYHVIFSAVGDEDIKFAKSLEEKFPRVHYYKTISIPDAAAMCGDALLAVTPDTGFLHIASAAKCPVVGLFLEKESRWHPYKVPSELVIIPSDYIINIQPPKVVEAVEKLIKRVS